MLLHSHYALSTESAVCLKEDGLHAGGITFEEVEQFVLTDNQQKLTVNPAWLAYVQVNTVP